MTKVRRGGMGLVLLSLSVLGLRPAASVEHQSEPSSEAEITASLLQEHPGEVLTFSIEEAQDLGYDFTPPQDLQSCDLENGFQGFDSPEEALEAAAAADEDAECALGIDGIRSVTIGLAEPTSDHDAEPYHFSGQVTERYDFKGAKGTFKVKDITNLAHPGTGEQFVVDRLLIKKQANPTSCQKPSDGDRWSEVGWSEHSNNANERLIYTWSTQNCMWVTYQPALTDGQFYVFRVRQYQSGTRTAILSGSTWVVLQDYDQPDCVPAQGQASCKVEDFVEVFTTVQGNHPDWTARIENMELELWKANDDWVSWANTVHTETSDTTPYKRCGVSNYDDFTVEKTTAPC